MNRFFMKPWFPLALQNYGNKQSCFPVMELQETREALGQRGKIISKKKKCIFDISSIKILVSVHIFRKK